MRWTLLPLVSGLLLGCGADGPSAPNGGRHDRGSSAAALDVGEAAPQSPYEAARTLPRALPAATCDPTAGDAHWLEEGQTVAVRLRCRSGASLADVPVEVEGLPRGAAWDQERAELRWRPGLDQAGVHTTTFRVPVTGESTRVKIGVAERFDDPDNVPVSAATYTEEMGLPVFHLTTDPEINGADYRPARVVFNGRAWTIEAKHRGRSSLQYPKKSYTLKFPKSDRFNAPERGFVQRHRLVLVSTFDDTSYVRQRLSYETWNRVGSIQLRTMSAVVYVDGAYQGVYTVVDAIDEELMKAHGLSEHGNLYKSVGHDADFNTKEDLSSGYEKKEGAGPEDTFDDLIELVGFVANSDDEDFRANIGTRIDLSDYWAWLITTTAVLATDTLAKNAYHYHDPRGGLWRVTPWDFNASWGQVWDTGRATPLWDPFSLATNVNRLFGRLLADPVLGPEGRARYADALAGPLALPSVLALFDQMVAEVGPAARRDQRQWGAEHVRYDGWSSRTDFQDFDGEVAYIRAWIQERWAYLATLM